MIFFTQKKLQSLIQNEVQKASRSFVYTLGGITEEKDIVEEHPTDYEILYQVYEEYPYARAVIDVITRAIVAKGYDFVKAKDVEVANPENMKRLRRFFDNCNPHDTFVELLEDGVRDQLVVGNGYIEIVRDANNQPKELWTLDPTAVKIIHDEHGRVTGFTSEVSSKPKVTFKEYEVLHLRMATKGSQPYGMSKMIALAKSIELDQYARKYNKAFFKRGARPRIYINLESATPEQIERNRKYLEAIADRPEHKRGDLLFEGKMNFHDVGSKPADLEFLELLKTVRDETLAVYGCPPAKVSLIETGNIGTGTGASQDKTFYEETIAPLQMKIGYKINKKLIQEGFGIYDWKFVFPHTAINLQEQAVIHGAYLDRNVLTTDEVRIELGRSPSQGVEKKIAPSEKIVGTTPMILALENKFENSLKQYLGKLKSRILEKLSAEKLSKLTEHLKGHNIEKRFVLREFGDYSFQSHSFPLIVKQLDDLEKILKEISPEEVTELLNRNLRMVGDAAGEVAGRRMRKKVPGFQYAMSPELVADLAVYAADLGGYFAKEIQDGLRAELLAGIQRGETIPQLAARIDSVMDKPAPITVKPIVDPLTGEIVRAGAERHLERSTRANLIARTETNRVVGKATLDSYEQSGVVDKVEISGENECEECSPYVGKEYTVEEAEGLLPIHHNCRCAYIPVIKEEVARVEEAVTEEIPLEAASIPKPALAEEFSVAENRYLGMKKEMIAKYGEDVKYKGEPVWTKMTNPEVQELERLSKEFISLKDAAPVPVEREEVILNKRWTIKLSDQKRMGKFDVLKVEPDDIVPLHEVRDKKLYDSLVGSMKKEGWEGRPVLVVDEAGYHKGLTGSHRVAAAKKTNTEIPIVRVSPEKLEVYLKKTDITRPFDEIFGGDDFARLEILEKIGDKSAVKLAEWELFAEKEISQPKWW